MGFFADIQTNNGHNHAEPDILSTAIQELESRFLHVTVELSKSNLDANNG